jgi:hypothetical protein
MLHSHRARSTAEALPPPLELQARVREKAGRPDPNQVDRNLRKSARSTTSGLVQVTESMTTPPFSLKRTDPRSVGWQPDWAQMV